jgi:cellulose binding protein with CBM10 domain
MRLELNNLGSALALVLLTTGFAGCSADGADQSFADDVTVHDGVVSEGEPARDEQGALLATLEQGLTYPYCFSAFSDPDGDGWGWELGRACIVMRWGFPPAPRPSAPSTSGSGSSGAGGASCSNVEGVYSTMAALAVAAAQELGRWQPTRDFTITRQGGEEMLGLSATGRAQCADGVCANTQALLDFQKREAEGQVTFPGNVKLSAAGLRSRLVARFREQQSCEMQPDNHRAENCPVEEHTLTFLRSQKGGCDSEFFFQARTPGGESLQYPAQLKNKLLWADKTNPYIGFKSDGDEVSIDPTYGLNEESSITSGACFGTCARISRNNVAGQCCACNGATRSFVRASWNAATFLCQ